MSDREKTIKRLEQFKADFKPFCGNGSDWERVDNAIALLKEQPDVVLCKDCKHYKTIHCTCDGCCISDNWFCADGEPKERE